MGEFKIDLYSSVSNEGKLQNNVMKLIAEGLQTFIGKRVHVSIKRVRNTRSDRQNAYYWACVIPHQQDCFLERWGEVWDKNEVHDWNKSNIWCDELINESTGEIIKKPSSSKTKTTTEFEERIEKLRQLFEKDFEWRIPLPNEQLDITNLNDEQ